jgi:hypothetical protein
MKQSLNLVERFGFCPTGAYNKRLMVTFPLVTSPKFSLRENFIKTIIKCNKIKVLKWKIKY